MYFERIYIGDSGVFGIGSDDQGSFNIRGWKNGDTVCFAKSYVGVTLCSINEKLMARS
jgi:hypothetical protein